MCAVILCASIAAPEAAPSSVVESRAASTTRDGALIVAVNSARALHLLPKLRIDLRLARAARFHSRDMLFRDYFAHGDLLGRMLQFHVRGRVFAENLAWESGIMSANATVARWLASPPHRSVLLDPTLSRIGVATPVGAFANSSRATVITADFAGG